MSTLKTPSFTAAKIEMTILFVKQYAPKPVWGRKGKKAHHKWHLIPTLCLNNIREGLYDHPVRFNYTALCGMDIQSNQTLYCFEPVGRNEKRCPRCEGLQYMREIAE